jgi:hypothetical protein
VYKPMEWWQGLFWAKNAPIVLSSLANHPISDRTLTSLYESAVPRRFRQIWEQSFVLSGKADSR